MRPSIRARLVAGALVSPLILVVLVILTFVERDLLRTVGWSAVHRTPVEWPSLLELGRYGWLLIATLVVSGVLGLLFSTGVWGLAVERRQRVEAFLIAVISIAVALEAFRPDSPAFAGPASWHDEIHNGAFPVIPVASVALALVTAVAARRATAVIPSPLAEALFVAIVVSLVLTNIDSIAQVGRYVYFGVLLTWIELYAFGTLRQARPASAASGN